MKRTLTSVAAAAMAVGMLVPTAFASTTSSSSVKWNAINITAGSYSAAPQGFAGYDHGSTTMTTFAPVYYVQQALKALGYDATWDGTTLAVTTPNGVTANLSGLSVGTGNASITVNGTTVKDVYTQVQKDPAGGASAVETTYVPIYYIDQLLKAAGESASWNGSGWAMTAPVAKPAVASVSGLNATQATVAFTTPVSSTDGIVKTHYSLNGVNPSAVTLSTDGKTATLTFMAAQLNVTNGAFVVNGIQTAANPNVLTATYANSFSFDYTTAPAVTSVSATTNGTSAGSVTVNFLEPVTTGYVSIDGSSVGSVASGANTVTFSGLSLATGTTHTLTIVNLTDANNNVAQVNQSFSVTVDKAAPTVSSVAPYSDHQILVTFSKPMYSVAADAGNPTTAGNIAVYNETMGSETVSSVAANPADTTGTQYIVTLGDASLYSTMSTRNLTVFFAAANKDTVGNALAATTKSVTLTKNTTAPTVTGINYLTNPSNGYVTDVLVSFSKPLTANASVAAPTVVDGTGALQSGFLKAGSVAANGTQVDFQLNTAAAESGVWTVNVPANDVTDAALAPNGNTAFSGTVNFGSASTASTWSLTGTPATSTASDVITVNFSQAVKGGAVTGSATNPSSYSINGVALPSNTVITLDSATHSSATITVPAGTISLTNTAAPFAISGVQNASGQVLTSFVQPLYVYDNTAPVLKSAHVVDNTHVILTFNEAMTTLSSKALTSSDLSIADYTGATAGGTLTASSVAGYPDEVEVTLGTALAGAQLTNPVTVTVGSAAADLTDADSVVAAAGTVTSN